jgi:uncharacterized membrane protein YeaQ/YmgE (transglycosylase-associated protein family)
MEIVKLGLLVIGLTGAIGGPYILYLAFFKPDFYPRPRLAKWQGAIATLVGAAILLWFFGPWK